MFKPSRCFERSMRLAALASLMGFFALQGAHASSARIGEGPFADRNITVSHNVLFRRALQGRPAAQTTLGYIYANGIGVPKNYAEAVKWLRLAADQGEPTGQFLLAMQYDRGQGVAQDSIEAEIWLNLATAGADAKRRGYFARVRDAVAGKLTLAEVALAQARSLEREKTLRR